MTTRKTFAALALSLAMFSGSTLAMSFEKPPTDEQVSAAVAKYNELIKERRGDREATAAAIEDAFGELDFSAMTADQLTMLSRVGRTPEMTAAAFKQLSTLAKENTVEGAKAAVLRVNFVPAPSRELSTEERAEAMQNYASQREEAIIGALDHDSLVDALHAGEAIDIFTHVGQLRGDSLANARDGLLRLETALTPQLPTAVVGRGTAFFQVLLSDEASIGDADRERIRTKLLKLAETRIADLSDEDENLRRGLESTRDFLSGALARGQLVDHPTPELEILWSSDPAITSMASLKGRVVVIDFWATWCGPCIASFPKIRELVEHYEGYPVTVLGVTSVQGRHYGPDRQVTDTKDDPSKEFELMAGYLGEMDITWPVVFSSQNVFNPDYGVRGIPHVAILDTDGVVRYRGMHPARPLAEKTEKIDALLKKAGMPTPPPVEADAAVKVSDQ